MDGKLFWWSPLDPYTDAPYRLWYVDGQGFAHREFNPQNGEYNVTNRLAAGYSEITWMSAKAMGAPI